MYFCVCVYICTYAIMFQHNSRMPRAILIKVDTHISVSYSVEWKKKISEKRMTCTNN